MSTPPPPTFLDLVHTHPFFTQPGLVSWVQMDILDHVRDQGEYGTGFYFAILNVIAARFFKNTRVLKVRLSIQHLIDAMYHRHKVKLGVSNNALTFLKEVGICMESKLPYNGAPNPLGNGGCEIIPEGPFVKIQDFTSLIGNFDYICDHIINEGPVIAEISASKHFMEFSGEGTYKAPEIGNENDVKQTVSVVGFIRGLRLYFIQNSIGERFGCHGLALVPESYLSNFGYPIAPYLYYF